MIIVTLAPIYILYTLFVSFKLEILNSEFFYKSPLIKRLVLKHNFPCLYFPPHTLFVSFIETLYSEIFF